MRTTCRHQRFKLPPSATVTTTTSITPDKTHPNPLHQQQQHPRRNLNLWVQTASKITTNTNRRIRDFHRREKISPDNLTGTIIHILSSDHASTPAHTCTVAQAIKSYIRPGLYLEPAKRTLDRHHQAYTTASAPPNTSAETACMYELQDITRSVTRSGRLREPAKNAPGGGPLIVFNAFDGVYRLRSLMSSAHWHLTQQKAVSFMVHMRSGGIRRTLRELPEGKGKERLGEGLDWQWRYAPHVWPDVLLRAMPKETHYVISPWTDGSQIQWAFSANPLHKLQDEQLRKKQEAVAAKPLNKRERKLQAGIDEKRERSNAQGAKPLNRRKRKLQLDKGEKRERSKAEGAKPLNSRERRLQLGRGEKRDRSKTEGAKPLNTRERKLKLATNKKRDRTKVESSN